MEVQGVLEYMLTLEYNMEITWILKEKDYLDSCTKRQIHSEVSKSLLHLYLNDLQKWSKAFLCQVYKKAWCFWQPSFCGAKTCLARLIVVSKLANGSGEIMQL